MRLVARILLVVSVAVGLGMLIRLDTGSVVIYWSLYRVDLSLNLAIFLVVLAGYLVYGGVSALRGMFRLPEQFRSFNQGRRWKQAAVCLRNGVSSLFEGRFGRAEQLSLRAANHPFFSGVAGLLAARSAHRMKETDRRDRWLAAAEQSGGCAEACVVTKAEFALDAGQPVEAVRLIEQRKFSGLRHLYVLNLLWRAHELSEDWHSVLKISHQLEKRQVLDREALRASRVRAYQALFAAKSGDAEEVSKLYSSLTLADKRIEEIAQACCDALVASGLPDDAISFIEEALEERWFASLVACYGRLPGADSRKRLRRAEAWRERYADQPVLLRVLGQLCAMESLWGKAEEFLRLAGPDDLEASVLLAELYEQLGREAEAMALFRSVALVKVRNETGELNRNSGL